MKSYSFISPARVFRRDVSITTSRSIAIVANPKFLSQIQEYSNVMSSTERPT